MPHSKTELLRHSHERERHKKQIARIIGSLTALLIVAGFIGLLNLSFLRVMQITFTGQTSIDQDEARNFINERLTGRHFGLVPKNSIFFIRKNVLIEDLKNKFPSLEKIKIDWPDLNTLAFQVTDRESKILWCVGAGVLKQCYYLDQGGRLYQQAPNFSDKLLIELHTNLPPQKIGTKVIGPKTLTKVAAILNFIKGSTSLWPTRGWRLASTEIMPLADFRAILARNGSVVQTITSSTTPVINNNQFSILFNTDQSANTTITNLHSVLKSDQFQKDWVTAGGRLEYLDLRFAGKVFYKFK